MNPFTLCLAFSCMLGHVVGDTVLSSYSGQPTPTPTPTASQTPSLLGYCNMIPTVPHTQRVSLTPPIVNGTRIDYECDIGYTANGVPFQLVCVDAAVYDPPTFNCSIVSCGLPDPNAFPTSHPISTGAASFQQNVFYNCNDGYTLGGYATSAVTFNVLCTNNGTERMGVFAYSAARSNCIQTCSSSSLADRKSIGTSGGDLTGAGVSLTIPASALASSTTISVISKPGDCQNAVPLGGTNISTAYQILPSMTLLQPVTISLTSFPTLGLSPYNVSILYRTDVNASWDHVTNLTVSLQDGGQWLLTGLMHHFSDVGAFGGIPNPGNATVVDQRSVASSSSSPSIVAAAAGAAIGVIVVILLIIIIFAVIIRRRKFEDEKLKPVHSTASDIPMRVTERPDEELYREQNGGHTIHFMLGLTPTSSGTSDFYGGSLAMPMLNTDVDYDSKRSGGSYNASQGSSKASTAKYHNNILAQPSMLSVADGKEAPEEMYERMNRQLTMPRPKTPASYASMKEVTPESEQYVSKLARKHVEKVEESQYAPFSSVEAGAPPKNYGTVDGSLLKLGKLLGLGQFGCVREGVLQPPDSYEAPVPCAVKLLLPNVPEGHDYDASVYSLNKEIEILRILRHRNIACMVGCVIPDGEPRKWRLMLELGSYSLESYLLKVKQISYIDQLKVAIETARGLMYIHGAGFVHRDIAARNILVFAAKGREERVIKVSDFGLAREISDDNAMYTQTHYGRLPPSHAPEQRLPLCQSTAKSDLYMFGWMLFEVAAVCSEPPPFDRRPAPAFVPKKCPVKIAALMHQCLKLNASDRPTFNYVHDQLVSLLHEAYIEDEHQYEETLYE